MKLPEYLVQLLIQEEADKLAKLYGTDLYEPYLNKLKEKYKALYEYLKETE